MFSAKETHGFVSGKTLLGLAGAGALSFVWWLTGDEKTLESEVQPLFETVQASEFRLELVEPGEIESAENIEIKSEVRSRSSAGVSILDIVPEGTQVKKGDFLVRLDDASLQKDLLSKGSPSTKQKQAWSRQKLMWKPLNCHCRNIYLDLFGKVRNNLRVLNL